jgi:hypothetical protein
MASLCKTKPYAAAGGAGNKGSILVGPSFSFAHLERGQPGFSDARVSVSFT